MDEDKTDQCQNRTQWLGRTLWDRIQQQDNHCGELETMKVVKVRIKRGGEEIIRFEIVPGNNVDAILREKP